MKQETITIDVPEGYEIDRENSTFAEIKFKSAVKGLPKRWEDLDSIFGYFANSNSTVGTSWTVKPCERDKNLFATEKQAEASVALAQLSQLMQVYNDRWKPDWNNSKWDKYAILFVSNELKITELCSTKHFLVFKSKDLAEEFLTNFKDLVEKAKPLL